jgi:hypothetical protein
MFYTRSGKGSSAILIICIWIISWTWSFYISNTTGGVFDLGAGNATLGVSFVSRAVGLCIKSGADMELV